MAADEEKTAMEVPEGAEASPEEEGKAKGGKSKLFLLAGVGGGAVVIALAVALFVIKPMMSGSDGAETAEATEQVADSHGEAKHEEPAKKEQHGGGHGDESAGPSSLIYAVQDIVVNPAGTGGSRFLSCSFAFELETSSLMADFAAKEPVVRDALITILSSKTLAQLTDSKQKEIVRYQIKKRVSLLMDTDELAGVYFTDFVLQ